MFNFFIFLQSIYPKVMVSPNVASGCDSKGMETLTCLYVPIIVLSQKCLCRLQVKQHHGKWLTHWCFPRIILLTTVTQHNIDWCDKHRQCIILKQVCVHLTQVESEFQHTLNMNLLIPNRWEQLHWSYMAHVSVHLVVSNINNTNSNRFPLEYLRQAKYIFNIKKCIVSEKWID